MSVCPKCGASVSMYDTGGNPWYACGSTKTFRSASCVDREPVATQLREAQHRIKRLEEALEGTVKWIVHLADSGDAGFWDVDEQHEIIAARAALKKEAKL